jgi:predicted nucleotidyltransferase
VIPPFRPDNQSWKEIVEPHREEILEAARRHHAKNVRVFGSVRRGEAEGKSDLDLLVTFDEGASLLDQIALKQELERHLRRKVDVVGDDSIYWMLAPQILAEAIPL